MPGPSGGTKLEHGLVAYRSVVPLMQESGSVSDIRKSPLDNHTHSVEGCA